MSSPVQVGQIIARKYRVDAIIGQGGMGVVVAATDTVLERRVAVKFLLPQYAQNALAADRFLREARATARLNSEHAIRIIEVGQLETGAPFMAMDLLHGVDLGTLVEKQGALEVRVAVDYVMQAARGLADAHHAGIVHRDIKPSNLFLAYQPSGKPIVKVLDFGVSKLSLGVEAGAGALTTTGQTLGSPLYMAPEQMRSSQTADARSDIWGLGVVLFELLTGTRPFAAESLAELVLVINQDPPLDAKRLRPDLPDALWRIIQRCLEKSPANRYANVLALVSELAPFGSGSSREARASSDPPNVGRQGTLIVGDHVDVAALARMANAVLGPEAGSEKAAPANPTARTSYAPAAVAAHSAALPGNQPGSTAYVPPGSPLHAGAPGSTAYVPPPGSVMPSPVPPAFVQGGAPGTGAFPATTPSPGVGAAPAVSGGAAPTVQDGALGSLSSAPWASTNDDNKTGARKSQKKSGAGLLLGVAGLGAVVLIGAVVLFLLPKGEPKDEGDIASLASELSQAAENEGAVPALPTTEVPAPSADGATSAAAPNPSASGAASAASAAPSGTAEVAPTGPSVTPEAPAASTTAPAQPPRRGTGRRPEAPKSAKERLGF